MDNEQQDNSQILDKLEGIDTRLSDLEDELQQIKVSLYKITELLSIIAGVDLPEKSKDQKNTESWVKYRESILRVTE